jgi:hypothetical protein
MYDGSDESLFGHDGRHKPNPIPELLTERGWGSSHGRLAYSNMNRQQDSNMSEYAINTIGMLPKNYVIINESTMDYNPETAFRVGSHRVAIPVKELARDRRLTIQEQWELMNPRYIGTYFNIDFDRCRSKRPDFDEAYQDAIANGEVEQFLSQFWTLEYEHSAAIYRLRLRLDNLEDERMTLKMRMNHKEANVKRIKSDIAFQRLQLYENIQKSLWKAEEEFEQATHDYYKHLEKIDKLKTYLKRYTIR